MLWAAMTGDGEAAVSGYELFWSRQPGKAGALRLDLI
jgi:hypothetical protein